MDLKSVSVEDLVQCVEHPLLKLVARATVYNWLKSGKLESIRLGSQWWSTNEAIENFVAKCSEAKSKPAQDRVQEFEAAETRIAARRRIGKAGA